MDLTVIIPDVHELEMSSVSFKSRITKMLKHNIIQRSESFIRYHGLPVDDSKSERSSYRDKREQTNRWTDKDRQTDGRAGRQADRRHANKQRGGQTRTDRNRNRGRQRCTDEKVYRKGSET